jgi:hypothetical protein
MVLLRCAVLGALACRGVRLIERGHREVAAPPRTLQRARRELAGVGHGAPAEHEGALRLHDHHAAQHAGGGGHAVELDQPRSHCRRSQPDIA